MLNPPPWTTPVTSEHPAAFEPPESALDFVLRAERGSSDLGIDRSRPEVVEVAQIWNDLVLDVQHHEPRERPVTVGSSTGYRWRLLGMPLGWVPESFARFAWMVAPMLSEAQQERRTDFYSPPSALPEDEFPLIAWVDGAPSCQLAPSWTGFVERAGERIPLARLRASGELSEDGEGRQVLALERGDRVVVDTGAGSFAAHLVPPGKRVPNRARDRVDGPFMGFLACAAFVGAMCGIILATRPATLDTDVIEVDARFVELFLQDPVVEKQQPVVERSPEPEGAKAKRKEGKVGRKDADMDRAKGDKVEMAKAELDKEIAETSGVLGALRESGDLDGVLGNTGLSQSILGGIGGLLGAKGVQYGSNGLSSRGSGLGGGGTAGTLGGLGTKGNGGGDSSYGQGSLNHGDKRERDVVSIGGGEIEIAGMDKALVDAVIRRHLQSIRYCYQRELQRDPELSGKVTVRFVIANDGSVSHVSTKSSTLGNASAESCINNRFLKMDFPKPKGRGIVIVSYPFLFAPG
jgi:hypothetical protein